MGIGAAFRLQVLGQGTMHETEHGPYHELKMLIVCALPVTDILRQLHSGAALSNCVWHCRWLSEHVQLLHVHNTKHLLIEQVLIGIGNLHMTTKTSNQTSKQITISYKCTDGRIMKYLVKKAQPTFLCPNMTTKSLTYMLVPFHRKKPHVHFNFRQSFF